MEGGDGDRCDLFGELDGPELHLVKYLRHIEQSGNALVRLSVAKILLKLFLRRGKRTY